MGTAMRPEEARGLLGVSRDADKATIKRTFRKLAVLYHPDKYETAPPEEKARAEKMMASLNSAYEVLTEAPMTQEEPEPDFLSILKKVHSESGKPPPPPRPEPEPEKKPPPPRYVSHRLKGALTPSEIMARDEKRAKGETLEYLGIFHQYHAGRVMLPSYNGYLDYARRIKNAPGSKQKKLIILKEAFKELSRRRDAIAAVHLVESLCRAGRRDSVERFKRIACAIAAFAPYNLNDAGKMAKVYQNFSGLDTAALNIRRRFGTYLQGLGEIVTDPSDIIAIIDETTKITSLESAIQIKGAKQFIDRRDPFSSYLKTLKLLIADPKVAKAALSIAKVFHFITEEQIQTIVNRVCDFEGDVPALKKILGELHWRTLFRGLTPVATYDTVEDLYRATVPKGVEPEIVGRVFNLLTEHSYKATIDPSVAATIYFVDTMLRAGAGHDASIKGFRHFKAKTTMNKDSVKDTPIRASFDKLFEESTYEEGMRELIDVFFP